jgi:hypothetical protein
MSTTTTRGAEMQHETVYRVVSPSGEPAVEKKGLSPRLDTLNGKTIGLLWNRVFRGDETLPMIGELLQERYPTLKIVPWEAFPVTSVPSLHAARQSETLQSLTDSLHTLEVDAVVTGNAG